MRRIPAWIILILAVLAVVLIIVGYQVRHEAGILPMILGILWALFVLGSAPKIFSQKH